LERNGVSRNGSSFGAKELARMRLEDERSQRAVLALRDAPRLGDERAMSQMHAVEIAERHHGALRVRRWIAVMTQDPH